MVLLSNTRDLGIENFWTGSLFLILCQSKYSLLKSTIITAYMGMSVSRTVGRVKKQNNYHISHHFLCGGEGMMV